MRIAQLKIAHLRALEIAEFSFKPGFNLIVGPNGAGKSTVLDALRICLSRILPSITASKAKPMSFGIDDIRHGFQFLDVGVIFGVSGQEFRFNRIQWKQHFAADDDANLERLRRSILETERLRDRARNLLRALDSSQRVSDTDSFSPSKVELKRAVSTLEVPPHCVFFSTNRSVVTRGGGQTGKAIGGTAVAYAEALSPRPWQVRQFADWMRVQRALATERPEVARQLEVLQIAATRFLPAYANLRPSDEGEARLWIDKDGNKLDVGQLSEGERGVLAMVLDLARRLAQASPDLGDPLSDGRAIVLIDELDLHLHPAWQRQIVHSLTDVFPKCQFIATTHSPQIIGEVESDRIQIIAHDQVYSPGHSFGVDSSRVLEEIMDADPRAREVQDLLSQLSHEIGKHRLERARNLLGLLMEKLGESDPDVIRARTLLDFLEGEE